jgi:hypothetical protein
VAAWDRPKTSSPSTNACSACSGSTEARKATAQEHQQSKRRSTISTTSCPKLWNERDVSELPERRVDLLISICGFAATPTLLAYELLRPRRLLVLRSQDANDSITLVGNYLLQNGRTFDDFQYDTVNPSDPVDIYIKIANWLNDKGGQHAVIDITGGRKVMSAAAALAAWQLKLDIAYVENQFDPVTRRPLHGRDRLIMLDNPTALFGEQEMARALEAFQAGAFEIARDRYDQLCNALALPGRARLMRAVSTLYRDWCNLDLAELPRSISDAQSSLANARRDTTAPTADRINRQIDFAERLVNNDPTVFVVWFYTLGMHYQRLGRLDFAAMLFYRTIEGCITSRLQREFPGLDPENFTAAAITTTTTLTTQYRAVAALLNPPAGQNLPRKLTLFAAAVLIASIDDDLARHAGFTDSTGNADAIRLTQLRDRTLARNRSVLAHGMATISAADTESLRLEANAVLAGYWQLYGDAVALHDFCAELAFLKTDR